MPLSHLQPRDAAAPNVHLLSTQYRMCPEIREVVSRYQYSGALRDADTVRTRSSDLDSALAAQPRAIWYVLDLTEEDGCVSTTSRHTPLLRPDEIEDPSAQSLG